MLKIGSKIYSSRLQDANLGITAKCYIQKNIERGNIKTYFDLCEHTMRFTLLST